MQSAAFSDELLLPCHVSSMYISQELWNCIMRRETTEVVFEVAVLFLERAHPTQRTGLLMSHCFCLAREIFG